MEKTATLNLRVNPVVKSRAEAILLQLGIPMSTAIDMYLRQIALTGGIPFEVTLPRAALSVDADAMTDTELQAKLERGFQDIELGRVQNAAAVFAQHRKNRE